MLSEKWRIFAFRNGALAEWSGAGLQNLSQWFDSATHLTNASEHASGAFAFPKSAHEALHVTWRRRLPLAARLTFLGLRGRLCTSSYHLAKTGMDPALARCEPFSVFLLLPEPSICPACPLRHLPPPGVSRFRQISYYLSNLVCAPVRGTSGEAGNGGQRGPVAAAHQGTARPVGPWMEYRRP